MDTTASPGEGSDLGSSILESVWRYKWFVAISGILLAAVAYGLSAQQTPQFESETTLLLRDPGSVRVFDEVRGMGDPARYTRNQAAIMTSSAVMQRAAEIAAVNVSPAELAAATRVEPDAQVDRITVTVRTTSPEAAAELANAIGVGYEQVVAEQIEADVQEAITELQQAQEELEARLTELDEAVDEDPGDAVAASERDAISQELATVSARARQLSVDASLFGGGVEVREPASLPTQPAAPRPFRAAAVGLVLGLAASGALAWELHGRRPEQARDRTDRVLDVPLLGEIPEFDASDHDGELPTVTSPRSAAAEAYQFLVAALAFSLRQHDAKVVLFTSASAGEGKTVTTANLAAAAARDDQRVLLIDADGRVRRLSRMVDGTAAASSVAHLASESVPIEWAIARWRPTDDVAIPFVAAPDEEEVQDPAAFFRSPRFIRALERLRGYADLVLIDSSPLLAVADAFEIAEHVDAVVLVTTPDTRDEQLQETKRRLAMVGQPLIGYVLNRAPVDTSPYSYGYEDQSAGGSRRRDAGPREVQTTAANATRPWSTQSTPASAAGANGGSVTGNRAASGSHHRSAAEDRRSAVPAPPAR